MTMCFKWENQCATLTAKPARPIQEVKIRLQKVLEVLSDQQFFVKPSKCTFRSREVDLMKQEAINVKENLCSQCTKSTHVDREK
jgi:hypothetical protein